MNTKIMAVATASVFALAGCGLGNSGHAPQSCRDALTYADEGFSAAADALGANSQFLDAISNNDPVAARDALDELQIASGKIQMMSSKYKSAKQNCLN